MSRNEVIAQYACYAAGWLALVASLICDIGGHLLQGAGFLGLAIVVILIGGGLNRD